MTQLVYLSAPAPSYFPVAPSPFQQLLLTFMLSLVYRKVDRVSSHLHVLPGVEEGRESSSFSPSCSPQCRGRQIEFLLTFMFSLVQRKVERVAPSYLHVLPGVEEGRESSSFLPSCSPWCRGRQRVAPSSPLALAGQSR